jgi:hypothetical protein
MGERGVRLDRNALRPPHKATTVRVSGGQTPLTDGPFAESREAVAGFDILDHWPAWGIPPAHGPTGGGVRRLSPGAGVDRHGG